MNGARFIKNKLVFECPAMQVHCKGLDASKLLSLAICGTEICNCKQISCAQSASQEICFLLQISVPQLRRSCLHPQTKVCGFLQHASVGGTANIGLLYRHRHFDTSKFFYGICCTENCNVKQFSCTVENLQ